MYGYPPTINTQHDVEYLVGYLGSKWATAENKQRGLGYLRALRDKTQHYVFDRNLDESEAADGEEPEYRVMEDDEGLRRQYRLESDPNAPIYRLGFTVEEVDQLIQTVENH
ncbi:hypothetical protein L0636_00810 [Halomonas janggokensis]|uniref:Uncharacterized protein n=1 Tax=Vreelandella janggokensis TaxID=370767 RepID=A0ABT4IRY3_9GAMM|nr:hypothetical protein [Halomonas janggokensis]MCZ0926427.1 hypothetical protein [Halomonas janggokensis]MCZ0928965.1 hypothetical protein [Halomonas janggokensis]